MQDVNESPEIQFQVPPEPTAENQSGNAEEIFKHCVCLALSTRKFGTRRKASMDNVEVNADKDLLHLGKDILDSDELRAVKRFDAETRGWLRTKTSAFPFKASVFVIRVEKVATVQAYLTDRTVKRKELVENFKTVYPAKVAEAHDRLRVEFNPLNYPVAEEILNFFAFDWEYVSFGVPATLKKISESFYENERNKAEATWMEASEIMKQTARAIVAGMIEHMVDSLTPGAFVKCSNCEGTGVGHMAGVDLSQPDSIPPCEQCEGSGKVFDPGKQKIFHKSYVEKLSDVLAEFKTKNPVADSEFEPLVDQARAILDGVDVKTLRSNEVIKKQALQGLEAVKAEMSKMVAVKSQREFEFDEEEN